MNTLKCFPDDFYHFLDQHTLVEISGGHERTAFTNIWMVHIGHRVFARSWNRNSQGWMNSFLTEGGRIRYGAQILRVRARKVEVADSIHQQISAAYLQKYTQEHNTAYAKGISQTEYHDYTVEFLAE